ncbi:Hypothetical predicted protein [Podarcis lilfordi]|uniref:Uncharacterized protein n=1 Tax=Podarcis lilfordi TaxID=74358 RepID=A0AA35KVZ8_9SAUR|nr:Hypothetical predicted protein [Podarcis lilfordi]
MYAAVKAAIVCKNYSGSENYGAGRNGRGETKRPGRRARVESLRAGERRDPEIVSEMKPGEDNRPNRVSENADIFLQ